MNLPPVRPAGPADLAAVVACQTACWEQAYRGVVPDSYLDAADVLARRAQRWRVRLAGEREVVLAEQDGQAVGVASAADCAAPPGRELFSLYVRQDWHGTGVADALLAAAIGWGPARVWLFTVNTRAERFYARHGFRRTGTEQIDPDVGIPEMLMERGPVGGAAAVTVDAP